jgi:hypothetical protein
MKQTTRRLLAGIVLAFAMVSTIAVAGDWPWYRPIGHDKNDTFNLDGSPVTNAGAIAFSDGTLLTAAKVVNLPYASVTNIYKGSLWSGAITNAGVGGTSSNILWYYRGAVTNVTYLP